jgi:hypothetical protein
MQNSQLIPSDIRWDPNATPPQFTNNDDTVIEPGTHVRVKIIGTRTEVGEMWAIGSIKEDYLGYVLGGDGGYVGYLMANPCPLFADAYKIERADDPGNGSSPRPVPCWQASKPPGER